jgi:hypothetical protein
MSSASDFISPRIFWLSTGAVAAPQLIDMRRRLSAKVA